MFKAFDLQALWRALSTHPIEVLALALVTSTMQFALSAWKWRLVFERVDPSAAARLRFQSYFFYSAISAFAANFLVPYVAAALIRGAAARWRFGGRFVHGAAASGYEQLFDVIAFVVPGLVAVALLALSAPLSAVATGAIVSLPLLVAFAFLSRVRAAAVARLLPKRNWPLLPQIHAALLQGTQSGLDHPAVAGRLMLASVLRYLIIGVRSVGIALLLVPTFHISAALAAFALVQLSQLAAVTPGNLGVAEWSWTGAGVLFGAASGEVAAFALTARLAGLLASLLIAGAAGIMGAGSRER